MNLAFIAIRYDVVGGTERDLHALTRQLAEWGHSVTIYCGEVRTRPPVGVKIVNIPILGFGRIARLWSVAVRGPRLAFRGGHDLVYSFARCVKQDVVRCGGGLHCTYLDGIQKLYSPAKRFFRSLSIFHRLMLWIERQQYADGNFTEITAISRRVQLEVQEVFGHADDRFRVIYDGIDLERFKPGEKGVIRKQFNIPDDATLLLFVGKGFKRKGLSTLLKAMADLPDARAHLVVVGADQDAQAYQGLARSSGLDKRVVFAGEQKDVERFYRAADLLVLPSRQEAFGNVVLEAMACGVPVIVSRVSGSSEVLSGRLEGGILEDHDDSEELKLVIEKMIDPDFHEACKVKAIEMAQGYSLEKNAREIEVQCEEIIRSRKRNP